MMYHGDAGSCTPIIKLGQGQTLAQVLHSMKRYRTRD